MKIVDVHELNGGLITIRLNAPRLDASTVADFRRDCEEFWQPGITAVCADLSRVDFIDSSGIGALLSLYKRLPPPNQTVKLSRVKGPVQAVIELLRLHRIFEIEA